MTTIEQGVYVFDGGTVSDHRELEAFYEQVWLANDTLDDAVFRPVWSADPDCVFFNTNGHAYYGLEDWFRIWAHYRTRLASRTHGASKRVRVIVRGDMAVFIDDWRSRVLRWVGQESEPDYITSYMRASVVCVREGDGWKGVHVHYSSGKTGPRPEEEA